MSVIWSGVTEEGAVVPVQVTDEGKVVAVGDGPQGDYLPTSGGNLTGDLTLGTDKITLNTDGSAKFAYRCDIGLSSLDNNVALKLVNNYAAAATLYVQNFNNSGDLFSGHDSSNVETSRIGVDGSASFAGEFNVGDVLADAGGTRLLPTGEVYIRNDKGGSSGVFQVQNGSNNIDDRTISFLADGSASFAGAVQVGDNPLNGNNAGTRLGPGGGVTASAGTSSANVWEGYTFGNSTLTSVIKADGSAIFKGDVVIGSRGDTWLIRESNGVAMLVQQSREASPMSGVSPMIPEQVRDIPSELDLIEMALNEVMEKLRMTPPAGWPVWDGSDNP